MFRSRQIRASLSLSLSSENDFSGASLYINKSSYSSATSLTVTAFMSLSWPGKVCLQHPSRISHSFALASHAPDTKVRESGASDRDITSPLCPRNDVHCWPVSMSHRALSENNLALVYFARGSHLQNSGGIFKILGKVTTLFLVFF